jgi:paraquat-inducible protein B
MSLIAKRMGFDKLNDAISAYRLDARLTGVDYPGESAGYLLDFSEWSRIQGYNISFGQGISETPVRMARFYGAIVNGGEAYTPHFLISRGDGQEVEWKSTSLGVSADALNKLIFNGLRAKLGITSILTGQLCVELDIMKNAVPVDLAQLQPYKGSPEIPTQLSSLDAALNTLENMPIQEILYDVMDSVKNMSAQLQKADFAGLVDSLKATSDAVRTQVEGFGPLRQHAGKTLDSYIGLADSVQKDFNDTMRRMNVALADVRRMSADTSEAMNEARDAMKEVRSTAQSAGEFFSEDSAPVLEFSQTMIALRKAAQSLSDLATLLEIKPNSLIFGRSN